MIPINYSEKTIYRQTNCEDTEASPKAGQGQAERQEAQTHY